MANSSVLSYGLKSTTIVCHIDELIKKSIKNKNPGNPARYCLQKSTDNLDQSESYRKITFGERDEKKPHKTILMVGETGTGKTTLINTMVNYSCGVQRKDKTWFEITDDKSDRSSADSQSDRSSADSQSDRSSAHSQTSDVTVYDVYIQEGSVDLTIIDTPGYGDTRGADRDKEIVESVLRLCTTEDVISEINAVCFVMKADQNRLTDRQQYIFDSVQSLFGKDIVENIVLLFTHSNGYPPNNALTAVKAAKIKCAEDEKKKQPIFFLFDNCQAETMDENYQRIYDNSWDLCYKGMTEFFEFLDKTQPKNLQMTRDVLTHRKQLEANISILQSRFEMMELMQNELKQSQAALEKHKKEVQEKNNFEYEVEVPYKEKVPINTALASSALICTVCEENCHYPGCWWTTSPYWCDVMEENHCTMCKNKCHYSKHKKDNKIYEAKKKVEKRTYEELKNKYEGKIGVGQSLVNKLDEELRKLQNEKIRRANEAFNCVKSLEMMALNTFSLFTLQHMEFLIEKLKEINAPEKAKYLEYIKKREGEERKGALAYIKSLFFK